MCFWRVHYCAGVMVSLADVNAQHIMCDIHSNANICIVNEIQSDSFVFLFTLSLSMCVYMPNKTQIVSAFAEKVEARGFGSNHAKLRRKT